MRINFKLERNAFYQHLWLQWETEIKYKPVKRKLYWDTLIICFCFSTPIISLVYYFNIVTIYAYLLIFIILFSILITPLIVKLKTTSNFKKNANYQYKLRGNNNSFLLINVENFISVEDYEESKFHKREIKSIIELPQHIVIDLLDETRAIIISKKYIEDMNCFDQKIKDLQIKKITFNEWKYKKTY